MPEFKTREYHEEVYYVCDACQKDFMRPTGKTYRSDPPICEMKCPVCGDIKKFKGVKYPRVILGELYPVDKHIETNCLLCAHRSPHRDIKCRAGLYMASEHDAGYCGCGAYEKDEDVHG